MQPQSFICVAFLQITLLSRVEDRDRRPFVKVPRQLDPFQATERLLAAISSEEPHRLIIRAGSVGALKRGVGRYPPASLPFSGRIDQRPTYCKQT